MKPFCANIGNYRYANGMTRQMLADKLTETLRVKGESAKVYTANDIWTYDGRGSMPRQSNVLVALAEIIGQPLDRLLEREFEVEELRRDEYVATAESAASLPKEDWDIAKLDTLPEEEADFILDLVGSDISQENGVWQSYFDIELRYNAGKTVTATMYYGLDYEKTRSITWKWQEYGDLMQTYDDECYILENKLDEEIFDKLSDMGLMYLAVCSKCDLDELSDERRDGVESYFVARVVYKAGREAVSELIRKVIDRAQKQLDKLLAQDKCMAGEKTDEPRGEDA